MTRSKETVIVIDETYELRRLDDMNWQLYKLSERRDGTQAMLPQGKYFHTLSEALRRVYELEIGNTGTRMSLEEAIKEAQRISNRLLKVKGDLK